MTPERRSLSDAPTVLVVDDQEGMRWVLSKVLRNAGYGVACAASAVEGLAVARETELAAAIVDYRLPDENGLRLFRRLRAVDVSLPAILISSYGSPALREEAATVGFSAYFDKPLDLRAVLVALDEAVKEAAAQDDG